MGEDNKSSGAHLLHEGDEDRFDHHGEKCDSPEYRLGELLCLDRELDGANIAEGTFIRVQDLRIPGFRSDIVWGSPQEVHQLAAVGLLEEDIVVSQVALRVRRHAWCGFDEGSHDGVLVVVD